MTVTTSYPGIYIQELPSLVHTITPSPTSIAVFVGYTHPFRTREFLTAVQLFSFADYQAKFGGFFSSPWQPDYVGQAVYQFFLNGGPTCYVVGLQAQEYYAYSGSPPQLTPQGQVVPAGVSVGGIIFTALEPVGVPATAPATGTVGIPMQVAISNVQQTASPDDTADIVISYGTTVETYRKVQISNLATTLAGSDLVTVTLPSPPGAYPMTGPPAVLAWLCRRRSAAGRGRYRHQPPGLCAGVLGLRVAGQGARLQPAGHARDHRQRGHLRSHRLLRA